MEGTAGVAGVGGGFGGAVADVGRLGGTSRSGEFREAGSGELAEDVMDWTLALRLPNNDREDDGGCSGSSEVGLVVVGDLAGEGDLFLGKEVERKRVGRLLGVGACLEERRKGKQNMSDSWKAKGKVKERVGGMEVEMRKGGQGAHLLL